MISRRTSSVPNEDVLPKPLYSDSRCSQACRWRSQVLPGLSSALPGAPKVLSGVPRCSQSYHNHSHGTPVPVIRDPSYSDGRPECPPRVWSSPEIDTSKFTLHILSDTPGGFQRLNYILLTLWCASHRVGSWDMARVFLAQLPLSQPGFSCPEWASWICMKQTLTSCKSLWMLSFQLRHASRATNKPPKRMYLQYVVHFVYFSLLYSSHVFFDFELVDPVHTDLSRHFTFRCRRLIPLSAC